MDESRFSRNIALFGEEGQRKIAATTVAIVGLGGRGLMWRNSLHTSG